MSTTPEGLHSKYQVQDKEGNPVGGCVVLRFDDPLATRALITWAVSVATVFGDDTLLLHVTKAIANPESYKHINLPKT